jgi:hypothetical protein
LLRLLQFDSPLLDTAYRYRRKRAQLAEVGDSNVKPLEAQVAGAMPLACAQVRMLPQPANAVHASYPAGMLGICTHPHPHPQAAQMHPQGAQAHPQTHSAHSFFQHHLQPTPHLPAHMFF